jgi:competence protein ComFC
MVSTSMRTGHRGVDLISSAARSLIRTALDFVYPPFCPLCENGVHDSGDFICSACLDSLPRRRQPVQVDVTASSSACHRFSFEKMYALYEYKTDMQQIVHYLKYRGYKRIASQLGNRLGLFFLPHLDSNPIDGLVPVPLHKKRHRERGFNQAELLARAIAQVIEKPVLNDVLIRTRYTPPQANLDRDARLLNVAGAFKTAEGSRFDSLSLAIVDDVFTTGSTIDECAKVLCKAGAVHITALTVARV